MGEKQATEETKPIAYTFDTADEWILLPTTDGHALVRIADLVFAVDVSNEGVNEGVTLTNVMTANETTGHTHWVTTTLKAESIARLLTGGA